MEAQDMLINPFTGLPPLKPAPKCSECAEFYEVSIPGVGRRLRCTSCNYPGEWLEKFEVKKKK